MKTTARKIALKSHLAYLIVMLVFGCLSVFGQKIDSNKIWLKPKAKVVSRIPVIKGSVQPYRPSYNVLSSNSSNGEAPREKNGKTLTILKIYPNPVVEQLNINLKLEKETNLSIKITDLLGNEIATLANEKMPHGEHTKTYNMPAKLNAGIYFLRIVAGGEPLIRRISVL
ncbi:T9SS type A sorting domain-containing protein [Nubsella zeaxanthinifaciens]|uniref:T9SS type A sorting domain-containing protein n=1 Tax=Nubsella zeaxanthinifaciens TaxID=392412 RepID=UPI003CFF01CE